MCLISLKAWRFGPSSAHTEGAAAIPEEATTTGCDLIAISTHARGGLPRVLLGSVADKVVRGAHTPVLVCHPAEYGH
jgi:nucleotide-binding universal stress UspA family protein